MSRRSPTVIALASKRSPWKLLLESCAVIPGWLGRIDATSKCTCGHAGTAAAPKNNTIRLIVAVIRTYDVREAAIVDNFFPTRSPADSGHSSIRIVCDSGRLRDDSPAQIL